MRTLSRRSFIKGLGLAAGTSMVPLRVVGQADFITIGAIVPLSGDLASFGPRFQVAAEIAVDEINSAGGLPGLGLLRLEVRDSGTDAPTGVAAAEELVNVVGVQAIFGAASSGVTTPIAGVTIPNQVVQISPSATSPALSNLADNDFLFRTAPSDECQGTVLAKLADSQGFSRVSVIARGDDYGLGLANVFVREFAALGGTVPSVSQYAPSTTGFTAEIASASASNPDVICLITFDEGEALMSQMVAAGVTNFNLFVDGNKNQDLIDRIVANVGAEALEGIVGTGPSPAPTAGGDAFDALYRAKLPEDPFVFTPHSYDAIAILALAMTSAGENNGVAIRDNIRAVANPGGDIVTVGQLGDAMAAISGGNAVNYEGAGGSQDFDANGDPEGPQGIWMIQGGQIVDTAIQFC